MRRSFLSILVAVGAVLAPAAASAQMSVKRPWTGYEVRIDPNAKPAAAPMHRILFVNKNGGTYSPGLDNSSTNTSSIVTEVSMIPAFHLSDLAWEQVMQCITFT